MFAYGMCSVIFAILACFIDYRVETISFLGGICWTFSILCLIVHANTSDK